MYEPGFGTEYTENFCWGSERSKATSRTKDASGLFDASKSEPVPPPTYEQSAAMPSSLPPTRDPSRFESATFPSVARENVIHTDDRGKYIDPFKGHGCKPYGRRLLYDDSHPEKMYASQWSSEIADPAACYSFPTTTGLEPSIPWCKDMQWQVEGEVGEWPTDEWKQWTKVAMCPTYDGHDDQIQYHQCKTQIP